MLNRPALLFTALIVVVGGCSPESSSQAERSPPSREPPATQQEVEVSLQVPDLGWAVRIERVYRLEDELRVFSRLSRSEGMAGQAISTVSDSVPIKAPDLPVRHYIIGKTWNWENDEPYVFLDDDDVDEFEDDLEGAELLYSSGEATSPEEMDVHPLGERGDIPLH